MKKLKSFFHISEEYVLATQQYKKTDFLLALLLYLFVLLIYYILGRVFSSDTVKLTEGFIFIFTGVVSIIIIGFTFALCLLRKQKLATIGFDMSKAKQSLKLGLVLTVIVVLLFGTVIVVSDFSIKTDIPLIVMRFFYYLIDIAFVEELVFRGYIGTRIYGCFKNKMIAIAVTGVLFVFMHIPAQMVMADMNFLEYISYAWVNFIFIFLLHFIFQFLYAKYNSIIAPTLFHFAWDYVQWFIV